MGQVDHFRECVLPGYLIGPVKARRSKTRARGWNGADVNELTEFPTGRLDDQVDPSANGYTLITDPRSNRSPSRNGSGTVINVDFNDCCDYCGQPAKPAKRC